MYRTVLLYCLSTTQSVPTQFATEELYIETKWNMQKRLNMQYFVFYNGRHMYFEEVQAIGGILRVQPT